MNRNAAGAVTVTIYPSNLAHEVEYIVSHSGSRFVVASTAAQLKKLIDRKETEQAIAAFERIWQSLSDLKTRTEIDQRLFSLLRGLPDEIDAPLSGPSGGNQPAFSGPPRTVEDVRRLSETVRMYVDEAIDVEEAGLEVGPPTQPSLVEELRERIEADPAFRAGFESLTPGRQREYNLYVSGAKQASTRASRVEKYAEKILEGKGLRDR